MPQCLSPRPGVGNKLLALASCGGQSGLTLSLTSQLLNRPEPEPGDPGWGGGPEGEGGGGRFALRWSCLVPV